MMNSLTGIDGQTSVSPPSHYPINMMQASHGQESPDPVKKSKKRRKWPLIVGGVAVVVVALFIISQVAFKPDPAFVKSSEELTRLYNLYAVQDPTPGQITAFQQLAAEYQSNFAGKTMYGIQKYIDALTAAIINYHSARQDSIDKLVAVYQKIDALFEQNEDWSKKAQIEFNPLDEEAADIASKLVDFSEKCYEMRQKLHERWSKSPAKIADLQNFISELRSLTQENIIELKQKWDNELYGTKLPYPVAPGYWRLIDDIDRVFASHVDENPENGDPQ